jgi:endoglucanase
MCLADRVKPGGMNIAGFDFGMNTQVNPNTSFPISQERSNTGQGTQDSSQILTPPSAQMAHFANDDRMNIFRLPAGWQFLLGNNLGGTLNSANFQRYDSLVQSCLATGAYCIIDVSTLYPDPNGKEY